MSGVVKSNTTSPWLREFLSEFMGTLVVMLIGNSGMAFFVLHKRDDVFSLGFCWGVAIMLGMLIGASNSGGHVNPMVTVSFAAISKIPWSKVPHYVIAQFLGAFASCPILYANYREAINVVDGGARQSMGLNGTGIIWTTFPNEDLSTITWILDTIICSSVVMFCILAIIDKDNGNVPGHLHSFYVALLVAVLVFTMGGNCMCAINPARDFSPRIFAAMIGYTDAFSFRAFWWIPLFVPFVGGIAGCYLYVYTIEKHIPTKQAPLAEIKELEELKKEDSKP